MTKDHKLPVGAEQAMDLTPIDSRETRLEGQQITRIEVSAYLAINKTRTIGTVLRVVHVVKTAVGAKAEAPVWYFFHSFGDATIAWHTLGTGGS